LRRSSEVLLLLALLHAFPQPLLSAEEEEGPDATLAQGAPDTDLAPSAYDEDDVPEEVDGGVERSGGGSKNDRRSSGSTSPS